MSITILFFGSLAGLFFMLFRKIPVLRTLPEAQVVSVTPKPSLLKTGAKISEQILTRVPRAEKAVVQGIKAAGAFSGKKLSYVFGKIKPVRKSGKVRTRQAEQENLSDDYWENIKKQ